MRHVLVATGLLLALSTPAAQAQADPHGHHHHHQAAPAADAVQAPIDHSAHYHSHAVGPAGSTYDLRWLDAMVQHHTGALRMSEFVFNVGSPGVGALANTIWREQAQEIKAMGQWRKAWYPEAPVYPVVLKAGGDPDAMDALTRMSTAQIQAMQMLAAPPTRSNRVSWFLEGMLQHHGAALLMAHDALVKSRNPTLLRLARSIIAGQRQEIIQLRKMLQHDGYNKPQYHQYDRYFSLR